MKKIFVILLSLSFVALHVKCNNRILAEFVKHVDGIIVYQQFAYSIDRNMVSLVEF